MFYLHKTPGFLKRLFPSLVWDFYADDDKTIYLTFDDGPIPEATPYVLKVLAERGAKATFFCVGENIARHNEIIQEVVEGGHSVANHTHNHLRGWRTSHNDYVRNVDLCEQEILEHVGYSQKLFRPPYGRITSNQVKTIQQEYQLIMWDVLTGDYNASLEVDQILHSVISHTRPGAIVLFHDSMKAFPRMKEVLPRYMDFFGEQGYAFREITH